MRDDRGGVLLLRGVNVGTLAKWRVGRAPGVDDEALDAVRDLGMNAIRLCVFWDAIEPNEGRYDQAYLAAVRDVVARANARGLKVMLDMHQDIYGSAFGSAGAPAWTVSEEETRRFREARFQFTQIAPELWFMKYFRGPVRRAFDRLYGPLADAFGQAWRALLVALEGEDVCALDVLNEPFFGTRRLAVFERDVLPRFYDQVGRAIREVNTVSWLALEPATSASLGVSTKLSLGRDDRVVYAPHCYPAMLELGAAYGDLLRPVLARTVRQIARDAERLNVAALVGEFGARLHAGRYLPHVFAELDAHRLGGFAWDLSSKSYGLRDAVRRDAASRPHPARVGGEPLTIELRGGLFVLHWEDPGDAGETRVTLPRGSFRASVSSGAVEVGRRDVITDAKRGHRVLRVERRG